MQHIIPIRFNIRQLGTDLGKNLSESWLPKRVALFLNYTLPSLVNQSSQNFIAYIMMHHDTNIKYVDMIQKAIKDYPNIKIIFVDDYESAHNILLDNVRELGVNIIVQTRFDNDDIYNFKLIETIQKNVKPQDNYVVAFKRMGFYFVDDDTYHEYTPEFTTNVSTMVTDLSKSERLATMNLQHTHYKRESSDIIWLDEFIPYFLVCHGNNSDTIKGGYGKFKQMKKITKQKHFI